MTDKKQIIIIVLSFALSLLILAIDLNLPLGVAGGVPYIALVLLGFWFPRRRHVFFLAAVGTALTLLGYFMSPSGGIPWVVLTNRGLALFAIWITAILIIYLKAKDDAREKIKTRLSEAQRIARIGSWEFNGHTGKLTWSDEMYRIFGLRKETFQPSVDNFIQHVHPEDRVKISNAVENDLAAFRGYTIEYRIILPEGGTRTVREISEFTGGNDKATNHRAGTVQDITERKVIEAALRKTQKMDAVGELAGGIAHDFNNILGVVMGNLEILQSMIADNPKAAGRAETALRSVKRGASLTKQLLGFSSRATGDRNTVSVNDVVTDSGEFVRRSLTKKVAVEFRLAEDPWLVDVDPGELADSILNLALNARDAMPDGGNLIIATANRNIDENDAQRDPGLTPGEYVMLSLSDSGTGMSGETIEKIYEPFFSTKGKDKGTGLGLAMVYGFVNRSGGHISVRSELGRGSEFRIFLPRSLGKRHRANSPEDAAKALPGGAETILVVDDERATLDVSVYHLTELGYQIFSAEDGRQALEILRGSATIDLLFSDVIMPGGIDGFQLARQARDEHPGLGILLTSGFAETGENPESRNDPLIAGLKDNILNKPYNKRELAEKVREALDDQA